MKFTREGGLHFKEQWSGMVKWFSWVKTYKFHACNLQKSLDFTYLICAFQGFAYWPGVENRQHESDHGGPNGLSGGVEVWFSGQDGTYCQSRQTVVYSVIETSWSEKTITSSVVKMHHLQIVIHYYLSILDLIT